MLPLAKGGNGMKKITDLLGVIAGVLVVAVVVLWVALAAVAPLALLKLCILYLFV